MQKKKERTELLYADLNETVSHETNLQSANLFRAYE